jgi:hypothetical protein
LRLNKGHNPCIKAAVHTRRGRGHSFCRAVSPLLHTTVFPGCASTLRSLPAWPNTWKLIARNGLSLSCRESRSPASPGKVSVPGLLLRLSLQAFRPARSVSGSQPRPFPIAGLIDARNPLPNVSLLFPACPFRRHSPSGLSSLRILALRPRHSCELRPYPAQGLSGKLTR